VGRRAGGVGWLRLRVAGAIEHAGRWGRLLRPRLAAPTPLRLLPQHSQLPIRQLPDPWSTAVRVDGRPLRWYAERGLPPPPAPPRAVVVESLQLWRARAGDRDVFFRAVTAGGASPKVLAHDLGVALGCGAHLRELRREALGGFSVDRAWTLDVFVPMARKYAKGYRDAPAGSGGMWGGG
jgi:tRNA pseudouridine55 synthase